MNKENSSKLTLLGRNATFPTSPTLAKLETFDNSYPQNNYWIHVDVPEFTSLCPVTGQPDFAKIKIAYIPDVKCVETKSLKYYLAAYRNEASFNEGVVNRILTDLVKATSPRHMRVEGQFAARGGIALTIVAEFPSPTLPGKVRK